MICNGLEPIQSVGRIARIRLASELFGLPVRTGTAANVATLAGLWFGPGCAQRNFGVVTRHPRPGTGLVPDGALWRWIGSDLARVKLQQDGGICGGGQSGCVATGVADAASPARGATALALAHLTESFPTKRSGSLISAAQYPRETGISCQEPGTDGKT